MRLAKCDRYPAFAVVCWIPLVSHLWIAYPSSQADHHSSGVCTGRKSGFTNGLGAKDPRTAKDDRILELLLIALDPLAHTLAVPARALPILRAALRNQNRRARFLEHLCRLPLALNIW